MALLLKESSDLISAYHHQQHFRHHHPMPPTFHHSLSSPTHPSLMHPTPKYPLDLRTSIIEQQHQQQQQQPFDAHESAARILFSAINWAKTVPAFVSLSNHDQVNRKLRINESNKTFALF
jgi:hypothetical protein